MRLRDQKHTPSLASYSYPCGRDVHLLPGDPWLAMDLSERVRVAYAEDAEQAGIGIAALMAFILWDDAAVEWESPYDPDEVVGMSGDALKRACMDLRAELFSRRSALAGIRPAAVVEATSSAIAGTDPKAGRPGGSVGNV